MRSTLTVLAASLACFANCQYQFSALPLPPGASSSRLTSSWSGKAAGQVWDEGQMSDHAAIWEEGNTVPVDLHPFSSFRASFVNASFRGRQVGAVLTASPGWRAAVWHGSKSTFQLLSLGGPAWSVATGVADDGIVGHAANPGHHAVFWRDSDHQMVDLNPFGFPSSSALASVTGTQVGCGIPDFNSNVRPILWHGSAESYVDLLPFRYMGGMCLGASGSTQVGWALVPTATGSHVSHAMVWRGSSTDYADLHPDNSGSSQALATDGIRQVGTVDQRAALWTGTADSYIDLNAFVPSGVVAVVANGIDPVTGDIVGDGVDYVARRTISIVWHPVPEPGSWVAFAGGTLAFFRVRRKGNRSA